MNFIFSMTNLEQQIMSCCMNSSLKNDLNYHLIFIQFSLNRQSWMIQCCYNWKKMNTDDISTKIQHLQLLRNLYLSINIKNYTDYLLEFIDQLIKNTMSWFRLVSKYSCKWWISEVQDAVHQAHVTHHQQVFVKKIQTLNQIKKKSFTESR